MRLVVDTNVFVSAALKEASWPGEMIRWISRYGGLLRSEVIEREITAVLSRPRIASKIAPSFHAQIRQLFLAAELVVIDERVTECRDPKDDKFLELALNGHADVIVSGEADLLVLGKFRSIPIITPAAFGRVRVM